MLHRRCESPLKVEEFSPAPILLVRSSPVPIGSIPELPAKSCKEIKESEGEQAVSGKYWFDSIRPWKTILAHCDMNTQGDKNVNECSAADQLCDTNANCTNTQGSFYCSCSTGFTEDGEHCQAFKATFTCDDSMELFADDTSLGNDNNDWHVSFTYGNVPGNTRVLSVIGTDVGGGFGILGSTTNGLLTNESWKCTGVLYPGWNSPDFDDQNWPSARVFGVNSADSPWGKMISGIETTAKWIWAADHNN
ncbi:unnamed protein product, partial [Porites evermanni]